MLRSIKREQFAFFEENYHSEQKTEMATKLQFKANWKDKRIGVFASFEFSQEKAVFMKIEVSCHFAVKASSWDSFADESSSTFTVPKKFLAHLTMITTGTARGVLFAKTEGTAFSKFIIPTLNVSEMIPRDITFALPED